MIHPLQTLPIEERIHAGGKGSALSHLIQAGYNIPNGFIILTTAFNETGLKPNVWQKAQALLAQHRQQNPTVRFAVRSSASSEDSAQASFAGEFETLLNQQSDEEIHAAINTVFGSRSNARSTAYSQAQGLTESHEMAIIVQEMVPADYAGIFFTADPVKSDRMRMVGSVVAGLGDQLVSGKATGEQFAFQQPRGKYTGPSTIKQHAKALFQLGQRLEKELGKPQDIEWAIAHNQLYLLQSRPITTMESFNPITGEWNDSLTGNYLWTGANAGEAFPEVILPLSWSISKILLNAASPPLFTNVPAFGIVAGRVYLNTGNVPILGIRMGLKRKTMIKAIEGVAGKIPDEIPVPDIPLRTIPLLRDAFRHLAPFIKSSRQASKQIPDFLANGDAEMARWHEKVESATTSQELISVWQTHHQYIIQIAPMMLAVGGLDMLGMPQKMIDQLADLVGLEDANALLSGFSPTDNQLESVGPMVGIAMLNRGEISREQYIQLYGHRGPNEGDMGQPRPGENPEWLDERIAQFSEEAIIAERMLNQRQEAHQAARKRLIQHYPRKSKKLLQKIDNYAETLHLRERVRSKITRMGWIWRLWALRAGQFTGLGDDVFYLTIDELLAHLNGNAVKAVDYIPQRIQTYDQYRSYPRYPTLIRGRFDPALWAADPNRRHDLFDTDVTLPVMPSSGSLVGIPGAMGVIEGRVRILHSINDASDFQAGEILVAVATDVGWTPVFPRAAAVITDIGAALSHAAIVARELGVPAVVGCGDATARLQTGDRVRVDGGRGVVEIL